MVAPGQASTEFRRRRWFHRRDIRFLIVVAAMLMVYSGYVYVTGPGRITDRLHAALERDPPTVNIRVTAKFPPEIFHIGVYQNHGAMRGTDGNTTTLFRVTPGDVRTLAENRPYGRWVAGLCAKRGSWREIPAEKT